MMTYRWLRLWMKVLLATVACSNWCLFESIGQGCCLGQEAQTNRHRSFEQEILPLLRTHCYECHDSRKQRSGLRLDVRDQAFSGGESGLRGIVPFKPEESEVWRRVSSKDSEEKMPPGERSLSEAELETLRDWIATGAEWPDAWAGTERMSTDHWAFRPPRRPPLPEVAHRDWLRSPIDAFVLARLEREGWQPAPEADRVTLVRRLYLDLIGLPPTPEEVDAWLEKQSPQAEQQLVEALLASPHFGERWGRWWLDAARYADSDGFEKDKPRFVWFYRDYVISAYNRDLPYNQFLIEQLAGDLLPNVTQDQVVATGFLRNSMINEEGGVDPEQFRMEAMFDRMDAIGKAILGLTIQCGQCHNHKYDPLTQLDYYRMFAFFNNTHEACVPVFTSSELQERAMVYQGLQQLSQRMQERFPEWRQVLTTWEEECQQRIPSWRIIQTSEDDPSGGQKMYRLKDGSYLCQGYAPTKHTAVLSITVDQTLITGFRLEQLNDPNLPLGGPGRSIYGTSALTEFKVRYKPREGGDWSWVKFQRAISDADIAPQRLDKIFDDKSNRERLIGPAAFAIDSKDETAWGIDRGPVRRNWPCQAWFIPEEPLRAPDGTSGFILEFHLVQNHGGWNSDDNQNHNLGRFRLSITSSPSTADAVLVPWSVEQIFQIPREKRSESAWQTLFDYWWKQQPDTHVEQQQWEELWQRHPTGASQLVLLAREETRPTYVLKRGDFLKPGDSVTPGVPAFLGEIPPEAPNDRRGFAAWVTQPNHPTTTRAYVNRIWQALFGEGLVTTPEDFGLQGEKPTHPELLDWLAVEFQESGWSTKQLLRLIVSSATYRQTSRVPPALREQDPQNRLLARGARFRVDAESVRDIALRVSGLLNHEMGGPSVYPPLPAFLTQPPASYGPKTWNEHHDVQRYRRALYTFRFRSVPYPALQVFDAPNGDFACVKRSRSNTPLQALTTLNEPLFVECAQGLASSVLHLCPHDDDRERLRYAWRRCVAREPHERELQILVELLAEQRRVWKDRQDQAQQLCMSLPGMDFPSQVSPQEYAAWFVLARTLLNLDETITRE